MDHVDHYAEAFTVIPGQCFRMIQGKAGQQGAPTHCPDPVEYRGNFIDAKGKHHEVEACNGHRADLDAVRRISGPPGVRSELPWRRRL
jgi:hypothetical protein